MLIHEGVRPHACPDCEYTTTTFGNLKIHLKWKHKRNVRRIFPEGHAKNSDNTGYVVVDEAMEDGEAAEYARRMFALGGSNSQNLSF